MNLRHFFSRKAISNISILNARVFSSYSCGYRHVATTIGSNPSSLSRGVYRIVFRIHGANYTKCNSHFGRYIHTTQQDNLTDSETGSETESETDATMNEFLSRFVWIMRRKVTESYPDCDKNTIEGMLLIIVEKVVSEMEKGSLEKMIGSAASTPSQDFSEDLWRTVWEVSNIVLQDMGKEKKKEKMKAYLQSEEVKEMYRFASEVGIRGDMLRELRFKWAREKMEESEFYQNLELLRKEKPKIGEKEQNGNSEGVVDGNEQKSFTLPRRQGKIKYKIYGLDLSDSKWAEVADKIHESSDVLWPQETKPISGKCKLVTDKILSLQEGEDFAPVLHEWISLHQPGRIDWISLLDRLKQRDYRLYLKIAEFLLDEESFQANTSDYSKLIDAHSKENRLEDIERILNKMDQNAFPPDVLTLTILVNMYSKSGNLEKAKVAYEHLKTRGFDPDVQVYTSMIMAYLSALKPEIVETLIREMEARDIKPTEDIYMAMLRCYSELGEVKHIKRIATTMQFMGFEPSSEFCMVLVEAYGQAGDPDQAREIFDHVMKLGLRPDDRFTASMIAAYEKKNLLDQALSLLLELEKSGFEPGVATNSVLIHWLGKMGMVEEAEQVLDKISKGGENPPLRVHVSLCEMYSRAGIEKKALQALGVLESRKEDLKADEFERVINSLIAGGFVQDARRMQELMKSRGFVASDQLKIALMGAHQAFGRKRQTFR